VAGLQSWYRLLMRAYPPRWRRERQAEMLATLQDLSAPGQRVPTARDAADIVRGGLVARWRQQPLLRRVVLIAAAFAGLAAAFRGVPWVWLAAGLSSIAGEILWTSVGRHRMARRSPVTPDSQAPGSPPAR
jgi:hypothetical protein